MAGNELIFSKSLAKTIITIYSNKECSIVIKIISLKMARFLLFLSQSIDFSISNYPPPKIGRLPSGVNYPKSRTTELEGCCQRKFIQ